MKKIYITFSLLIILINFCQADLIDLCKHGKITLSPDKTFGRDVEWSKIFYNFNYVKNTKKAPYNKSMVISDNGDIFISNKSYFRVYKFYNNGNFDQKFADTIKKNSPKNNQGNRRIHGLSILDNQYLIAHEFRGKIRIYDLKGNIKKLIKVNYMIQDCIGLKNGQIAIQGLVPWKDRKSKEVICFMNIETEKSKIIYSKFKSINTNSILVKFKSQNNKKQMLSVTLPFSRTSLLMRRLQNSNILIADPNSSKIQIFSSNGKKTKEFDLSIKAEKFSELEKKRYIDSIKKSSSNPEITSQILKKIESSKTFFPKNRPYFYQIIIDQNDNLFTFVFEDRKEYTLQIFSPQGKYLTKCLLDTGNYKTSISQFGENLLFYKDFLYGLFTQKNHPDSFLKLEKMRITASQ